MKKLALLPALVLVPALALAQARSLSSEVRKLREEIAAIKLDRTLDLSKDQAQQLLPLLKETAALRDQLRAEQQKREPEIVKALAAVRDDLAKAGAVSEASRKALQAARGEATMDAVRAKLRAVHERLGAVLKPDQKARLAAYDHHPLDTSYELEGSFGEGARPKAGRAAKLRRILKVAASPDFIALTEARAR